VLISTDLVCYKDIDVSQWSCRLFSSCVLLRLDKLFLVHSRMLFQQKQLEKMMHMAIVNNRVSFVRLLLENGVSLREFLTADELVALYNDVRLTFLFN